MRGIRQWYARQLPWYPSQRVGGNPRPPSAVAPRALLARTPLTRATSATADGGDCAEGAEPSEAAVLAPMVRGARKRDHCTVPCSLYCLRAGVALRPRCYCTLGWGGADAWRCDPGAVAPSGGAGLTQRRLCLFCAVPLRPERGLGQHRARLRARGRHVCGRTAWRWRVVGGGRGIRPGAALFRGGRRRRDARDRRRGGARHAQHHGSRLRRQRRVHNWDGTSPPADNPRPRTRAHHPQSDDLLAH